MTTFALLPSPFLGASMWQPVVAALADHGRTAYAVALGPQAPRGARDALDEYLRSLPADHDLVLVPHSNAGLYVPAIAARRSVSAVVFVDAALPPLDGGTAPLVSRERLPELAAKADEDGLLPPWTRWWDEADVAVLFPDDAVRDVVESEQRRLPLSYLEDAVDVPAGWAGLPCTYLAFGATYQEEAGTARDLGWPTRQLDGGHLEMLVEPDPVARSILELADAVRQR